MMRRSRSSVRQSAGGACDHLRVQVTEGTGRNLYHGCTGGTKSLRVVVGLQIADDYPGAHAPRQMLDRFCEQQRLA